MSNEYRRIAQPASRLGQPSAPFSARVKGDVEMKDVVEVLTSNRMPSIAESSWLCNKTIASKTIIPRHSIVTNNHSEDGTEMSLFGAQPAQAGGGLFGRVSAPTQTTTGNMFGNNNQAQNIPPTSSVFGGSQPQTATGSSPFGNLNSGSNQEPNKPSLFGAAQPATTAPTSTPSLFGGLNATNTSVAPSSTNNLFSGLGGIQQPNGGGRLFGALANNNNQQQQQQQPSQLGGSPFGASTLTNNGAGTSQAQTQPQNEQFTSLPGSSTTGALFNHLIERGRKRQGPDASRVEFDDLPSLQLGLGDIASKVRNLGGGLSRSAGRGDSRA